VISDSIAQLRTWAEIDLSALRHNLSVAKSYAGDREIMAVVKADAYGHGLAGVVAALADEVRWFGVANVSEGLEVAANAPGKVLVLGPVLPHERAIAAANGFVVTVSSFDEAMAFDTLAKELGIKATLHLTIDTGMGRMGCLESEAAAIAEAISGLANVRLDGIATHFPSADEDANFTRAQISMTEQLRQSLPETRHFHLSNSAGLLEFAELQKSATLMRPGLMLYGLSPLPKHQKELRPVLSLKSRVTLVRELPPNHGINYGRTFITERAMRVATIGIGYGDGYPRSISGSGADVLIHGQRCPLLGRVTMDQIVVDVSGLEKLPEPGEEAVLIGEQGDQQQLATELAEKAGTISWEILTGITRRVQRVYR
jgi:alanine racemase